MFKKIFTPQEANRRLPYVKKVVQEILEKGKALRACLNEKGQNPIPAEALKIEALIEGLIEELEEIGCYYKDWNFEIGLVDFPALIHGEEVLLCWRSDEPQLQWYHGIEDGYAGRMLIPEHLLV